MTIKYASISSGPGPQQRLSFPNINIRRRGSVEDQLSIEYLCRKTWNKKDSQACHVEVGIMYMVSMPSFHPAEDKTESRWPAANHLSVIKKIREEGKPEPTCNVWEIVAEALTASGAQLQLLLRWSRFDIPTGYQGNRLSSSALILLQKQTHYHVLSLHAMILLLTVRRSLRLSVGTMQHIKHAPSGSPCQK